MSVQVKYTSSAAFTAAVAVFRISFAGVELIFLANWRCTLPLPSVLSIPMPRVKLMPWRATPFHKRVCARARA